MRESQGDAGAFKDERMESFQQAVAVQFLRQGWLRFYRLQIDGLTIAVDYNFCYAGIFSFYITGYDNDKEWSRYGPGRQIMAHSIRCAIDEGMDVFDFLRGDESYKYYWKAEPYETKTVRIAISLRAKLLMRARKLKADMRARRANSEPLADAPTPSP